MDKTIGIVVRCSIRGLALGKTKIGGENGVGVLIKILDVEEGMDVIMEDVNILVAVAIVKQI